MNKVFISHVGCDKPFAIQLAKDLEGRGVAPWIDVQEIKVGETILWKIIEALEETDYFILVISQEAWNSEWVKNEIAAAWERQIENKGKFILPVYYKDTKIPLLLRGIKYADFRTNYQSGLDELIQVLV